MAKNETVRIRPTQVQADVDAFTAVQALSDFAPANPAYTITALQSRLDAMNTARQAELHAQNALEAARDTATAAEWDFHNSLLGLKDQVIAQYGDDSDEIQALGLKKKSERKTPTRRAASA